MASDITGIAQSSFSPNFYQLQAYKPKTYSEETYAPLNSFADEDSAIISAEAQLQYEAEKFNSGEGDALDLALTEVTTKFIVEAEVNVINTKTDMLNTILSIGEDSEE